MSKRPPAPQNAAPGRRQPPRAARTATRTVRTTSRTHHDDRGTRLALWVGGGVVLLVLLLVGIGYYNTNIGPANDTAIVVGNHTVSLGYYRDRLKATTVDANQQATQVEASNEESTTTDTIEEEQVYLQRAQSDAGVSVSENDITLAMAKLVQVPTQGNQITDRATYEALLQSKLQREGLSLDQFREIARANALKDAVLAKLKSQVPQHTLAVQLHELVFTSQQQGQAAQQRLEQGESFADLEQESVGDPSIGTATPIDWTPVPFGILPGPIDEVAAKLQPGQVSDLIEVDNSGASSADTSNSGPQWYLVEVTNRDPNYAVPDTAATQIANAEQTDWVNREKQALNVRSLLTPSMYDWAVSHSGLPLTVATPTAAPASSSTSSNSQETGPAGPAAPTQSAPAGVPPVPSVPAVPPVPNGTP